VERRTFVAEPKVFTFSVLAGAESAEVLTSVGSFAIAAYLYGLGNGSDISYRLML
jgi:hypothetical protein